MSIITNEIEERYPYPDNGERPTGITSLGQCLASRKAYRAGHYERTLTAKAGRLELRGPKLKGAVFESAVIERHRRREESVDPPLSRQVPAR